MPNPLATRSIPRRPAPPPPRRWSLVLLLLAGAGCESAPRGHRGPVTAVVRADGGMLSCSQAALHTGSAWLRPPFRPFALAAGAAGIVVAGGVPAERGRVALLGADGTLRAQCTLGDDVAYTAAVHPAGDRAAVGCADGTVHLLSLPDLTVLRQLARHTAPCRAVLFSPDGATLASGGRDGLIHLDHLASGGHDTVADHTAGVTCLLFAGDHLYSGAEDGKVRVHVATRLLRSYQGMQQPVVGLATRDGAVVAGLRDGRILGLAAGDDTYSEIDRVAAPLFALTTAADGRTLVAGLLNAVGVRSAGGR